jgi:hypothetical protein
MTDRVSYAIGSLMMAASGSSMGLSAFQHDMLLTSVSVAGFPIAYSVAAAKHRSLIQAPRLRYAPGVLLGAALAGSSLVTGAQAVESLSPFLILVCALGVLTGYLVCHESYVWGFLQ